MIICQSGSRQANYEHFQFHLWPLSRKCFTYIVMISFVMMELPLHPAVIRFNMNMEACLTTFSIDWVVCPFHFLQNVTSTTITVHSDCIYGTLRQPCMLMFGTSCSVSEIAIKFCFITRCLSWIIPLFSWLKPALSWNLKAAAFTEQPEGYWILKAFLIILLFTLNLIASKHCSVHSEWEIFFV